MIWQKLNNKIYLKFKKVFFTFFFKQIFPFNLLPKKKQHKEIEDNLLMLLAKKEGVSLYNIRYQNN